MIHELANVHHTPNITTDRHQPMGQAKQTLAINSVFLNSPLTSVTSPLLSNSVHLNRNSFDAFAANDRLKFK